MLVENSEMWSSSKCLFCISKYSFDRKQQGCYLLEGSKNRNVGVEQNTKPQRLCYTGAAQVFKAEHSKTLRNRASVACLATHVEPTSLLHWHIYCSFEGRHWPVLALLLSGTTILWHSWSVPSRWKRGICCPSEVKRGYTMSAVQFQPMLRWTWPHQVCGWIR